MCVLRVGCGFLGFPSGDDGLMEALFFLFRVACASGRDPNTTLITEEEVVCRATGGGGGLVRGWVVGGCHVELWSRETGLREGTSGIECALIAARCSQGR